MAAETKIPESQFAYVVLASRRARQLMTGARPLADGIHSRKPTRIAIEELELNLLEYELPAIAEGDNERGGSRRKG